MMLVKDHAWGVSVLIVGIGLLLVATGIIPVEPRRGDSFVALGLFGFALSAVGLILIVHHHRRLRLLFSACAVAAIAGIALWGACMADARFFRESPIALLSKEANLMVAKIIFGCFGLLGVILLVLIVKRLFNRDA